MKKVKIIESLFFVVGSILFIIQGWQALERGEKWQGIGLLMYSLYMTLFLHAIIIAKIVNIKLEVKSDHNQQGRNIRRKENKLILIFLFLLIIAMLFPPLAGLALEKNHSLQCIILLILSFYIMMFLHAAIIFKRINLTKKFKHEI